jgi:hypothetical protein
MSAIAIDNAELSSEGKEAIRRWRGECREGSEALDKLTEALNGALNSHIDKKLMRRIKTRGQRRHGEEVTMEIRFTDDEINEALVVVINTIADSAGLSDKDRAVLKRWRSSKMRLGSDDLNDLVLKANDDFAQNLARRERSQIRKPDWVD